MVVSPAVALTADRSWASDQGKWKKRGAEGRMQRIGRRLVQGCEGACYRMLHYGTTKELANFIGCWSFKL